MDSTSVTFGNVVGKENMKGLCEGSKCSQERSSHVY